MTYTGIQPDLGYMGDRSRGASLGRGNVRGDPDTTARFHLRHVRLNAGGYDSGGAYWGHGGRLYHYQSEDGETSGFVRVMAADKRAAFEARGGALIGAPGHEAFAARWQSWSTIGWREAAKDLVRQDYPDARFFGERRAGA